ncbi:MAG TPA: prepilin-type N-terminal cleavage/methylation domain-containing protein [Chromatiaceae bacterium]|nr:prepilin-type N-terminal cleavage/methylation domain-containing protein [Chromatiaceae bacterium]
MNRMQEKANQSGLTLLELMVVIAVLVAVAALASGSLFGTLEVSREKLTEPEMMAIAEAVRQFKKDTGYYPKQGPFNLNTAGGEIALASLPEESGGTNAEKTRWFYSPANFYQLTRAVSPLAGTGHMLENWRSEAARGWRGPYLKGFTDGYVDIRDGINDGTPDGNAAGNPLTGNNIPDVPGVADPFQFRPEPVGGGTLMDWAETPRLPSPPGRLYEKVTWGRPYLLFGLDAQPLVVCMGPDGEYNTADDIFLDIH